MYDLYLGRMLLPVTPQKISMSISNKNQTVTLIDEGEINILKAAGLTELSFTALIPQVKYPFARYEGGSFTAASVYLDYFEQLKSAQAPFQFILSRRMPMGKRLFDTNLTVSMEDYSISEDAKEGFDLKVDIRLKQYRQYGTKTIEIGDDIPSAPVVIEEERTVVENPEPSKSSSGSKKKSSTKTSNTTNAEKSDYYNMKSSQIAANNKMSVSSTIQTVTESTGRTTTTVKKPGKTAGSSESSTSTSSAKSAGGLKVNLMARF